jgi:uncharacterized membrane protein
LGDWSFEPKELLQAFLFFQFIGCESIMRSRRKRHHIFKKFVVGQFKPFFGDVGVDGAAVIVAATPPP